MWQRSGSKWYLRPENPYEYISQLNKSQFVGYDDWRLPTLEEAMSLMEPIQKNGDLYIDSVFDQTQQWIITSDGFGTTIGSNTWIVSFNLGYCGLFFDYVFNEYFVRAVR